MTDDLSCKELVDLVTDYLEAALSLEQRERFDVHLEGCVGCEMYLEQMRLVIAVAGRLVEDDVPAEAAQELREAFRQFRSS
jgi:hypothetical protein